VDLHETHKLLDVPDSLAFRSIHSEWQANHDAAELLTLYLLQHELKQLNATLFLPPSKQLMGANRPPDDPQCI